MSSLGQVSAGACSLTARPATVDDVHAPGAPVPLATCGVR